MVSKLPFSDLLSLSVAERILLVETIWDSIADFPESVRLTDAQRRELDARLEAYHRDPTAGSPWDIVKARIAPRS
ncbi:MAG: addiction module protein [Planctomycetota bacterium]